MKVAVACLIGILIVLVVGFGAVSSLLFLFSRGEQKQSKEIEKLRKRNNDKKLS